MTIVVSGGRGVAEFVSDIPCSTLLVGVVGVVCVTVTTFVSGGRGVAEFVSDIPCSTLLVGVVLQ